MDPISGLRQEIEKKRKATSEKKEKWAYKSEHDGNAIPEKDLAYDESEKLAKRRKVNAHDLKISVGDRDCNAAQDEKVDRNSPCKADELELPQESVKFDARPASHTTASHVRGDSDANVEKSEVRTQRTSEPHLTHTASEISDGTDNPKSKSTREDRENMHKQNYVVDQIRKYIRVWESELEKLSPDNRKKSVHRAAIRTLHQTKEWLKPLQKLVRKKKLKKSILNALADIFEAAEKRDYIEANRLYLERLAIGTAPWPMGATMVGIHARAAREKIGEDKIAHVMNDEQARKYIQSIKRLLTVAERNFPKP